MSSADPQVRKTITPLRYCRQAGLIVRDLFFRVFAAPDLMPAEWVAAAATAGADEARRARGICDYIAGMTDRYATAEHHRLFDETPDLHLGPAETKCADGDSRSA